MQMIFGARLTGAKNSSSLSAIVSPAAAFLPASASADPPAAICASISASASSNTTLTLSPFLTARPILPSFFTFAIRMVFSNFVTMMICLSAGFLPCSTASCRHEVVSHPTIDQYIHAIDVASMRTDQEQYCICDVFGHAQFTQRYIIFPLLTPRIIFVASLCHRRVGWSRGNAIASYSVTAPFETQLLDRHQQGGSTRRIKAKTRRRLRARHIGRSDKGTVALGQMRMRIFRHRPGRPRVNCKSAFKCIRFKVDKFACGNYARVADHRIYTAHMG